MERNAHIGKGTSFAMQRTKNADACILCVKKQGRLKKITIRMDNKKELVFGPIEELPQLLEDCDRVVELGDGYSLLCVAKRLRLLDKNSGVFKPFQYNPSAVIKDWAVHSPFSHAGNEVGIKQAKLNNGVMEV